MTNTKTLSPDARAKDITTRRQIEQSLRNLIHEGQEDGSVGHCDPALAKRALVGAFNGISRSFRSEGDLTADDVAEAFIDLFVTRMGRG